jgi:hypothetical protein
MRNLRGLLLASLIAAAAGCSHNRPTHVDGGVLGRVVIYRNGVAFYERNAIVHDGKLTVRVPRDRVDDFLKSLTIVDRATKKPMAVSIPRQEADDGSYLTMTLETQDKREAHVLLTYVTEAPAWKPSYRVVVGQNGKVLLEGWAIVDNTTSEDWKGVLVGVGASSALAFRYDLWSVRTIDRDLLQSEERFAIAPPSGISPYSESGGGEELAMIDPAELRGDTGDAMGVSFSGSSSLENQYIVDGVFENAGSIQGTVSDQKTGEKLAGVTIVASNAKNNITATILTDEHGSYGFKNLPAGQYVMNYYYADITVEKKLDVKANKVTPGALKIKQSASRGEAIRITDSAPSVDPTSTTQGVRVDKNHTKSIPVPGRTFGDTIGSAAGSQGDLSGAYSRAGSSGGGGGGGSYETPKAPSQVKQGDEKLKAIAARVLKEKRDVVVEVHSRDEEKAKTRGISVKNKLVNDGVMASKIHVVHKVGETEPESVRVVAVAPGEARKDAQPAKQIAPGDTPVGESHFMADRPMTVKSGSSAMVAMLHGETTGGVVYLYDPISERGDKRFAFKAIRLDNPTNDTLEPGPVTVYGDGRFIGEGITEPVPPSASVVVPFALDKQIVIERNHNEQDRIAKLVTVQRGVVTAEVQHRRTTRFTITSRLNTPSTVYVRHKLEQNWLVVDEPSKPMKVGDSQLYKIDVGPGETKYVSMIEATPVEKSFDLASDEALGMMKVFINEPDASPKLKEQITAMLATHRDAADMQDKIATLRDQLVEYRQRSGELHAQVVTLKAVKTGGELLQTLKTRLTEMADRIQKTTIEVVDTQEKLMLARVKFQNQLADLKLTDITKAVTTR